MNNKMKKIHPLILPVLLLALSLAIHSCGGDEDKGDPAQNLTALCVRQCVLETADASLCDTNCACASEKLSKELSEEDIHSLIGILSNKGEGLDTSEAGIKFKNAFSDCNSGVK